MIKFKKVNITKFSQTQHIPYYELDLLRQTTIKRLVDIANQSGYNRVSAEQFKTYLLKNIERLLDSMIKGD